MINQKSSPKIFTYYNKTARKRWVVFLLPVMLLFFLFSTSSICFAYTYDSGQIDQLKKSSAVYTNTADLEAVQKLYSFDQLIALRKKSSDVDIVSAAREGKTIEQSTDTSVGNAAGGYLENPNVGVMNAFGKKGYALAELVLAAIIGVLAILASFLKLFVEFGGRILDLTLNPSLYNFTNNTMIKEGWVMVRDVCNLFFLLALLFIAFCTILKIEKYHARKTLLMLIIMALLINFSKPIAVFIFDGSQLLMNFFLSKFPTGNQGASTVYAAASNISKMIYDSIPDYGNQNYTSIQLAIIYLFAVVFLFMLGVAFFVIAIFLIIRIVAIILLIILSPFAFFASVIPDFNKMSSSWWDALFKYSFYGPAAAFFLLLALKSQGVYQGSLSQIGSISITGEDAQMSAILTQMLHYFTTLVFLYASIIMANKFSLQFSKAITDRADKFMKWAGGMTKTGGMWGWGWRRSGLKGGLAQRVETSPWTRWMTKRGGQKAQAEREARIASMLGVKGAWFNTFQKESEEENKGLDNDSVIKKAQAGDQKAALRAVMNGDGDDLGVFKTVLGIIEKHPEVRDHFRHLYRKSNQAQFAAELQAYNPRSGDINKIRKQIEKDKPHLTGTALERRVQEEIPRFYANKELGRLYKDGLAKLDWNDFTNNPGHVREESHRKKFKEELHKRLDTFAKINPSDLADLMSTSKGDNQDFVRENKDFEDILEKAKRIARGGRSEELDARDAHH